MARVILSSARAKMLYFYEKSGRLFRFLSKKVYFCRLRKYYKLKILKNYGKKC